MKTDMSALERIGETCSEVFDALYRPTVILLLAAISHQLGNFQ